MPRVVCRCWNCPWSILRVLRSCMQHAFPEHQPLSVCDRVCRRWHCRCRLLGGESTHRSVHPVSPGGRVPQCSGCSPLHHRRCRTTRPLYGAHSIFVTVQSLRTCRAIRQSCLCSLGAQVLSPVCLTDVQLSIIAEPAWGIEAVDNGGDLC